MSEIFCSFIIPTIGRQSLTRAVQSVLAQEFPKEEFEVIVVNDSGVDLPEAGWNHLASITILNTNRVERSLARNSGAAVAQGRFLLFLDDDDWILPETLSQFWESTQSHAAGLYYGGYRFVNINGNTIDEHFPDERGDCFIRFMSGEWQPLQASLINARVFHSLGGFLPLGILLGGDEDVDLTRRLSLKYDIAGTNRLVAVIRRDRAHSTTNYSNLQAQSRNSRDRVLNLPGSCSRLCHSARDRAVNTAYWHGRLAWIYLGSMIWNLQQGKLFTCASRLVYFCASTVFSCKFWLSPGFWRGLTRPHHAKGWLSTS